MWFREHFNRHYMFILIFIIISLTFLWFPLSPPGLSLIEENANAGCQAPPKQHQKYKLIATFFFGIFPA